MLVSTDIFTLEISKFLEKKNLTLYFFSRAFFAICCFWWRFGLSVGSTVDPSWPSVDKKSNSRVGRPSIFSSLCFIEIWSWIAKPKFWDVVFRILSMMPSGGSSAPKMTCFRIFSKTPWFCQIVSKKPGRKWTVLSQANGLQVVRQILRKNWTVLFMIKRPSWFPSFENLFSEQSKLQDPRRPSTLTILVDSHWPPNLKLMAGHFRLDPKTYRERLHRWVSDWKWHLSHFYKLHSTSVVSLFESNSSKFVVLRDTLRWKHFLSISQIKCKLEEPRKEFVWSYFDVAKIHN